MLQDESRSQVAHHRAPHVAGMYSTVPQALAATRALLSFLPNSCHQVHFSSLNNPLTCIMCQACGHLCHHRQPHVAGVCHHSATSLGSNQGTAELPAQQLPPGVCCSQQRFDA